MLINSNIHKEKEALNLGLVGRKLSHSFSKKYFEERYGITAYRLIEIDNIGDICKTVEQLELNGFNVTIPYKCDIVPLLDELDPAAREIGAVNTVVIRREKEDGKWKMYGYNTDAPAFLETLHPFLKPQHRRALILGSGGASLAVSWALRKLGIEYRVVSRSPLAHSNSISYDQAHTLVMNDDYTIIINATPVGMYPNNEATPWPWPELVNTRHLCYDLVYNPSPTLFLQQAASNGATVIDGLAMLHRQADLALEIWRKNTQ